MPSLVYPSGDFVPFTKILSAEVNGKFNAITTLLNVTKLDSTNVQDHGLNRNKLVIGTPSQVVMNDSSGDLTSVATLPVTNGGLGFNPTLPSTPGFTIQVNNAGTGLTLDVPPTPPALRIWLSENFG